MKRSSIVFVAALLISWGNSFGQVSAETFRSSVIQSYKLFITTNKTTNLVFPYAIKSADRGSSDIIAQKVKDVENILQVKAGTKDFPETNLTVITTDGKLYSFMVDYSAEPTNLNIRFYTDTINGKRDKGNAVTEPQVSFTDVKENTADVQHTAEMIVKNKTRAIRGIKDKKYSILLRLFRIYVKENALYYQVQVKNTSNINYDIDMIRFFIRDEKQAKRTAIQEIEMIPVYTAGNTGVIKAHAKNMFVFAFEKYTIPDVKYFVCEVREKNGGRNLSIKVHNSQIIRAHMISNSK